MSDRWIHVGGKVSAVEEAEMRRARRAGSHMSAVQIEETGVFGEGLICVFYYFVDFDRGIEKKKV